MAVIRLGLFRGRTPRDHWQRRIAALDPEVDYEEVVRIVAHHEFPWDVQQALSFALFRTYAVPRIGRLLFETGQFTTDTQRRHDDTVLILDTIASDGMESASGRAAVRRMNDMHGSYAIDNDDMRYVLSTFVVMPSRWIESYGWRAGTDAEQLASVRYYQRLGHLMGIKDIPSTFAEFAGLMDSYERDHFGHDVGARAVAEATLDLFGSFYPWVPRRLMRTFSLSIMEPHLCAAFGFRRPPAPAVRASRAALKLRAIVVRRLPTRLMPKHGRDLREVKSYGGGFRLENLGTFPAGCPVAPADEHRV